MSSSLTSGWLLRSAPGLGKSEERSGLLTFLIFRRKVPLSGDSVLQPPTHTHTQTFPDSLPVTKVTKPGNRSLLTAWFLGSFSWFLSHFLDL